ncbi:MAG: aromatic ring-hydroxylating dioxygenase subunit alpha [Pseudomonadota bacterium]
MTVLDNVIATAHEPLERAQSLPFSVYTDPDILVVEAQQIFASDWVFVCMANEIPNPGDYYSITLAGEPIVVIRQADQSLTGLINVCRHRGTVLLDEGFGHIDKYITCPYHAWAYDLEGVLKAIPHNQLIAVDREAHQLDTFQVATWNGLVFVNLDNNAPPLTDRLRGIDDYLRLFEPHTLTDVSPGEPEVWQTNWKLAMENAMESYHLFQVHEQTLETISPTRDAYYIAGSSEWSLTGGATQRKKGMLESVFGGDHNELLEHYVLVSLPPSFVGVLTYGSFGWLSAHPIDAGNTRIRSGATVFPGYSGMSGADPFTKAFFDEDRQICERVQRGMQSRLGRGGKLTDMERVVVDFHQYLATRLGGSAPTPLFEEEAATAWREAT